jgi:hypothetical protein
MVSLQSKVERKKESHLEKLNQSYQKCCLKMKITLSERIGKISE